MSEHITKFYILSTVDRYWREDESSRILKREDAQAPNNRKVYKVHHGEGSNSTDAERAIGDPYLSDATASEEDSTQRILDRFAKSILVRDWLLK